MTLISIKKTAVVEAAPTGTVSLYVDSADSHLKQVDEAGAIIDLTDGSAISAESGTWIPAITDQVGAATITVTGTSFYSQMGDVVTDSCTLVVTMDAGQSIEEFNLSCAVTPASNFGSVGAVSQIWSAKSPISEYDSVTIRASTGTKKTYVAIAMNGTEIEAILTIQRTYSIL